MISLCSSCWQWLTALAPSCSNKKPDRLSVLACLNPTSVMQKCGLWCDLGILPQYLGSQSLFADTVCNPVFSLPFGSKTQDLIGCISSHNVCTTFRQRIALRFARAVVQPSEKARLAGLPSTKLHLRPIFASKHHPALSPHVGHKELQESRWRTP